MDLYDLDIRSCSSEDGKNSLSPYKSRYELVVERDGQIIKYGSEAEVVALPEVIFNKVVELPDAERKDNFIVIFDNHEIQELSEDEDVEHESDTEDESQKGCRFILFTGGVPDRVGDVDLSIIEAAESFKIYTVNEIKAEDLLNKHSVNFTKIDIDLSDQQLIQSFLLKSKFSKLLENKPRIVKAVISLVIACGAGYFAWNETQDFTQQVVYREEHRDVDQFADYRNEVASTYNSALVTNALLKTWSSLHHLPAGWKAPVITFKNGLVSSEVKHDGGTLKALDEFIAKSGIQSSFHRNGLTTVSNVSVDKTDNDKNHWDENWQSFSNNQDHIIDLAVKLGGNVESKIVKEGHGYRTSEVKMTINNVPVSVLNLLSKATSKRPIFMQEVRVTNSEKSINSGISISYKVVGTYFDEQ